MRAHRIQVLTLTIACAAGCGGSGGGSSGKVSPVPRGVWTWMDVAGSACDDGTPTGIAVNGGDPDQLVIYFQGGGACWDYTTCVALKTAVRGPFGKAQWDAQAAMVGSGGAFDRQRAGNPLAGATFVFVPYCTGDLHAGNNVAQYTFGTDVRPYHHVGRVNTAAYAARLSELWPDPAHVVVSGSSAGGYGAVLNYTLFRDTYPDAKMDLIDDSGPLLEGDAVPASERTAWFDAWKLGEVTDPLCPACRDDLGAFYPIASAKFPDDRMALLSSLQDATISFYFMLPQEMFQTALLATIHDRLDPTPNLRAFVITGEQHVLLQGANASTTNGVMLDSWLGDMLADRAAWPTVLPP